jgi:hypothetical protein
MVEPSACLTVPPGDFAEDRRSTRIRVPHWVAHAGMAAADQTKYEFFTQVDAQRKQIGANMAIRLKADHPECAPRPGVLIVASHLAKL